MTSKSLNKVTRRPLRVKETFGMLFRTPHETTDDDRVFAIIAGALVERGLERLIKNRLRQLSKAEADALFVGNGALSSLSAKIQIAYALGIIGKMAKHDLETIKDIRNVFAHSAHSVTFKNKYIANRCKGLHLAKESLGDGFSKEAPRRIFETSTNEFNLLFSLYGLETIRPKLFKASNLSL